MRKLKAYQVLCWAIFLAIVYIVLANTVPPGVLILLFNGAFLGACVAIAIVYAPLAWFAIRQREFSRVSQLALGIVCIWTALAMARVTSVVSHASGNEKLVYTSWPIVLSAYLALIGGILHVTAPGTDVLSGKFQGPTRWLLIGAITTGFVISFGVFIAQLTHRF